MIVVIRTTVPRNAIMDYIVIPTVSMAITVLVIHQALSFLFFYLRCSGSAAAASGKTTKTQIVQTVGACDDMLHAYI
tara:strand:+ start:598 stop:828 length:231 start_codon:yes stop_codon:yes gene_type:complete